MYAKDLLTASRTDVFLVARDRPREYLDRLDLRLVQSVKLKGEDEIEVKFVDIPKLCELAERENSPNASPESRGIDMLRDLLERSAELLRTRSSLYDGG